MRIKHFYLTYILQNKFVLNRGVFWLERALTGEEKIRRAEEIYQRRKSGYTYGRDSRVATVSVKEEKNFSLFKKMFLQIAICLVIYFIFYLIQNSNYIFSEGVIDKTKQILSYDIDIASMYEKTLQFISQQMEGLTPNQEQLDTTIQNEVDENAEIQNEIQEQKEESQNVQEEINGVGGAELQNVVIENSEAASADAEEQIPQTDEEYIKSNFSFIKPIEGVVSSEFGLRNSDNPIVSKNHTGIDIAANTGTVIKAAMAGTVTISSTVGDYGYHIKITNNDVSTLYAHCSKLYVSEGEVIEQGQEIAEVGSTGKSTGPHLHFEIMRGTTYINPRSILEF